jgi:hypothetical protein
MSRLGEYVHGRSGDKGSDVTIGVIPYDDENFGWLKKQLTERRVREFLGSLVEGEVHRTLLPNLPGIVFRCEDALPGGGLGNLRTDAQGKTYFQALAKMEVEVPE